MTINDRKELYSGPVIDICNRRGIDPKLFMAIIEVESDWDVNAIRYEPTFKFICRPFHFAAQLKISWETEEQLQKFSWGPGQIMGAVARELGFEGPLQTLSDLYLGAGWAAMHLKKLCNKYPSQDDCIAAYNAGSPMPGKDAPGKYANQEYVDKVKKVLAAIA